MPANKNALLRYRIIDRLLASRKGYTYEQIAAECSSELKKKGISDSVSKITIRKDISFMKQEYGVIVEILRNNGRERPLAYALNSNTINGNTLLDPDIQDLQAAISILETVEGIGYVRPAIENIKKKIQAKSDNPSSDYISFSTAPDLKNSDMVWKLYRCIYSNIPLIITYHPYGKDAYETEFQPYFLKCYNSRWFLFGWNYRYRGHDAQESIGRLENLAIDRIESYCHSRRPSMLIRSNTIDFKTYFDNVIGVTYLKDATMEDIRIRIHTESQDGVRDLNRLITKPLHKSQQVVEKYPDHTDIVLHIYPNQEFYSAILAYSYAEIVSPGSVRSAFLTRLRLINSYYNEL